MVGLNKSIKNITELNRQNYNYKVLRFIRNNYILDFHEILKIEDLIDKYHRQRFGQIICNYICPDYRESKPCRNTQLWLRTNIFPKGKDFFYEEPWDTLERLKNETFNL